MISNVLSNHIIRTHKISCGDYKNMFPGAKTVRITDEQNQKQTQTKLSKDSVNQQFLRKQKERKKELEDIGTEPLVCDICGFTSMYSLVSHITRKHDVLMSDYRAKYPSTVVQRTAPSQTVKMIAALKKFYQDPENLKAHLLKRSFPSEVKHWTRKGFSEKEARIKKLCGFARTMSRFL